MTPPNGRATKPTANVPNDDSVPITGSTFGKNSRLKTSAAAVPYRKKSYHSIVVPMKLARMIGRIDRRSPRSAVDVDRSVVVVAMLDPDLDDAVERPWQPIGPLDGGHAAFNRQFLQAQIVDFDRFQAVQIDVVEHQPSSRVFLDQSEGRAGDLGRVDAEPLGQAAHERGLSCPEIAGQQDDVTRMNARREVAARGNRFIFRAGGNRHAPFSTTLRRAVSSITASPR